MDTARGYRRESHAAQSMWRGMGEAWTAVSYLICGIAVWGGLGWLLDRALHTTPVLFVIGALLGKAGGVYLVYIRAMGSQGGPSRAP